MHASGKGINQLRGVSPQNPGPEVQSSSIQHLLTEIQFKDKVSVVVQNGRALKSGYEEGYFRNHSAT